MFDATIRDGVLQLCRNGTRWLSTGWAGGRSDGAAAYNVTVPTGWNRTDIDSYVDERLETAGFEADGSALLTGVSQEHARGARHGPVVAYATVGLSNPATLPVDPDGVSSSYDREMTEAGPVDIDHPPVGTCNLVVGTTRDLGEGSLANLVSVATEAKTATLLDLVGFTGTTSDAVVAACDPAGEPTAFSGSATPVGDAARACVREAITASFRSRYADEAPPQNVSDADHGVVTATTAEVFDP
ncbi:MAG: adenosylcobinamide amidohydrolase [Halapricum sp.]